MINKSEERHHYKSYRQTVIIMRDCYEQFYTNKFRNLDEMKKLLRRHKFSEFTKNKIDNLNGLGSYLLKKLNL